MTDTPDMIHREAALREGFYDPAKVQTCNLSAEEIAERDRPKSRQERRQIERRAKKKARQSDPAGQ
jgi:hypothetical protein